MPANLPAPQRSAPATVPMDSPLALFAPAHAIETLVPAPLHLFELFQGTLRTAYQQDDEGYVASRDDHEQVRVLRYADGLSCSVRVEGSRLEGLPTQNDVDYLLALFRICDAGDVEPDGTVVDPSYRSISIAAGRTDNPSGPQVEAVKRALRRWAHVRITTTTEVDYGRLARSLERGQGYPTSPDGVRQRELEATHHVLDYQVETETRDDYRRNNIRLLRIDPVWLDQARVGITTWIDVDAHNRLTSATAKRLYQVLAIRAARGILPPHVWTLDGLKDELGIQSEQKPGKITATIRSGLEGLRDEGIVERFEVERVGRGEYVFTVRPGERLVAAGLLRGVGGSDQSRTRVILWHLRRLGVGMGAGRAYLAGRPTQTLAALRRAYFLQVHRDGVDGGRRVDDWAAWLRAAIEGDWAFEEPGYLRWLDGMATRVAAEGEAAEPSPPAEPAADEPPAELEGLGPGIHPFLAARRDHDGLALELRVHQHGSGFRIGAFQGELAFDPDRLELLDARFPSGLVGAWERPAEGRVSFAAVADAGADQQALLTFRFAGRDLRPAIRSLRLSRLAAAGDYRDLTHQVAERRPPLVLETAGDG